jgi:hypothetical protein
MHKSVFGSVRNAIRDIRVVAASVIISVGLIGAPVASATLSAAHPTDRSGLPANKVMKGEFALGGGPSAYDVDDIKLPKKMKYPIAGFRFEYIAPGGPYSAKCPGVGQVNPQGYVCVYVRYANYGGGTPYFQLLNPMTGGYGASTSRMLFVMTTGGGTRSFAVGSWALRTGDASTATRTSGSGKAGVLK